MSTPTDQDAPPLAPIIPIFGRPACTHYDRAQFAITPASRRVTCTACNEDVDLMQFICWVLQNQRTFRVTDERR